MEISNDIKKNDEKIIIHGKRADAIVKGMLQHSRQTSGAKNEPISILYEMNIYDCPITVCEQKTKILMQK